MPVEPPTITKEKKQLTKILSCNEHTLVQMNSAEFIELTISHKQKQGMSKEQAANEVGTILSNASPAGEQYWDKYRDKIKTLSGYIPVFDDGIALAALAIDMQRSGNVSINISSQLILENLLSYSKAMQALEEILLALGI
ncbi:hypothetical protein L2737_14060 [Shewanella electrodiphila]|uniref:Uncharacterized protein n=1 Tax=Shewanella electrodiphila TaxID=934143 RepID=A0ABT0KRF9_9GAMM|nr:hypothetical protein [Shewanella electrodiphila]MCL1046438.1 hypothetical protein [Shewanella electrodiphila]